MHKAFSQRRSMFLNSSSPSRMRLVPREARRAMRPLESAPATAEERATRQAMFEKGRGR
jgi:hypothetical protein